MELLIDRFWEIVEEVLLQLFQPRERLLITCYSVNTLTRHQ